MRQIFSLGLQLKHMPRVQYIHVKQTDEQCSLSLFEQTCTGQLGLKFRNLCFVIGGQ